MKKLTTVIATVTIILFSLSFNQMTTYANIDLAFLENLDNVTLSMKDSENVIDRIKFYSSSNLATYIYQPRDISQINNEMQDINHLISILSNQSQTIVSDESQRLFYLERLYSAQNEFNTIIVVYNSMQKRGEKPQLVSIQHMLEYTENSIEDYDWTEEQEQALNSFNSKHELLLLINDFKSDIAVANFQYWGWNLDNESYNKYKSKLETIIQKYESRIKFLEESGSLFTAANNNHHSRYTFTEIDSYTISAPDNIADLYLKKGHSIHAQIIEMKFSCKIQYLDRTSKIIYDMYGNKIGTLTE
jgi:hypothetical protein